jgi:thiamine-phosphate pyrophosphorylase
MRFDKRTLALYAVTDRRWLGAKTLYSQCEEALKGGATFLQLREKTLDRQAFRKEALEIKELCRRYGVPFVLDDDVELAAETGADGVHVGQSDMEAGKVREKLGRDKILGVSAQTVEEAVLAERRGADYLGVGAVFSDRHQVRRRRRKLPYAQSHLRGGKDTGHRYRRHNARQYIEACRQRDMRRRGG